MLQIMRQHRLRSPLVRLLLLTMVLRALVPVGFMPAANGDWPGLQICGSAAALLAGTDGAGVLTPDGGATHPGTAHESCPFASSPAAAPAPQLVSTSVLDPVADAPPAHPALVLPAPAFARAHPPRGPPSPV